MPFRAAIVKLFGASSKQSSSSTSGGSTTSDSIAMTVEVVSPLRDAHCSSCSLPLSRNAWQTGLTSRADAKSVDSMPAADDAALPQARLPSHTSPHRPPTALGRNTTRSASLSFGEPSPLVRGGRAMSVLSLSTPPDCAFPEAPADSPPAAARERFIHDRHDRHDQRQPQPGLEPGPGPEPGPVQQQEKQPEQWNHWNGTAARAASVASLLNSGAAATGTFGSGNDGDDDGDDCTIDDDLNAPAGDGGSSSLTFLSSYGGGGYCCCRNSPTVAASSATTSTALRSGGLGGGSGDLQSVAPQEQETPGDFMWLDLNDSPPPPDFEHVLGLITSSTPPSPHQQQQASSRCVRLLSWFGVGSAGGIEGLRPGGGAACAHASCITTVRYTVFAARLTHNLPPPLRWMASPLTIPHSAVPAAAGLGRRHRCGRWPSAASRSCC